ncbi:MAG: DNA-processing protein DprA [Nitrospirales bacterium]|nr:DNA-processing protein DprA [Nitrospirales bacterium]
MPKPLTWVSLSDPAFPSSLVRHLGDKSPKRIAAIGNLDLVNSKAVALICSVKCPGTIILQTYDIARKLREAGVPVIGGFHSPMERECLRILLRGNQPLIICPARSLDEIRLPKEYKKPLDQGRLLLLSPFSDKLRRATVQTSLYRNRFVAALAECLFVPYAAPSGKTEQLCSDFLARGKRLYTLECDANLHLTALGAQPIPFFLNFR